MLSVYLVWVVVSDSAIGLDSLPKWVGSLSTMGDQPAFAVVSIM